MHVANVLVHVRGVCRGSVTVSLSPIGNAPVLKQKKFTVARERTIGWMNQWLRKNLKCDSAESVVRFLCHF